MKLLFLVLFTLTAACSHEPARNLASSERPKSLEVDVQKSSAYFVKHKRFLIQAKNSHSQNIEISFTDVQVKNSRGKIIPFQIERVSSGKYYILPVSDEKELQISIQNKVIGKQFNVSLRKPDKGHSSITIISRGDHSLVMRLKLADKKNRPVTSDELPEILLDGDASVEDLRPVEKGVWEFTFKHPENNVIVYLSVRCQEVFLEHIYRFQHVEK